MPIRGGSWAWSRASFSRLSPNFAPIATLIAMPLVMAVFSREWLYTPIGHLDPWYNVGFFLYYHDPTFLADHYKLQRLPWILPGWLLYHLLGPEAGNFVLHVGALVVSTVFVYLTLAKLVARQSAFLVAAFLTIYIPFHGSGGWDYQAAGAGAYYAVMLYLIIRAAHAEDPRNGLAAAGAVYAAAFFTTIQLINFLPVLAALYYVAGERHRTPTGLRTALVYSLLGFVGLAVALCVVNMAVGRGPLFFWPLLKIVLERVADPVGQKPWLLPWSAFLVPSARFIHLVFPAVMLVASILRLSVAAAGVGRLGVCRTWLLGQYVLLALLWILWQHLGHTALYPGYFAHVLIIPAFLALAGMLGGQSGASSTVPLALLAIGLLLACVPAFQGAVGEKIIFTNRELMTEATTVAALATSAVAIVLAAIFIRGVASAALMLLCVAGFTFGYLQISSTWYGKSKLGELGEFYSARRGCVSHGQSYREIVRLMEVFRSENPVLWQTWLWRGPAGTSSFSPDCLVDLNLLRGSVHSTGVSNLGLTTDAHPSQIADEYLNYVVNDGLVVALVQHEKDADGLVERFAAFGNKLTFIRQGTMNLGRVPVRVIIYRSNKAT